MRGVRPPPARRFSSHIPFAVHVCSLDAASVWLWDFLSARGMLLSPLTCSSPAGSGCNRPVAETWFKILHAWWTKNNCDWSHSWNKNSNLEISWSFTKIFLFPSKQLQRQTHINQGNQHAVTFTNRKVLIDLSYCKLTQNQEFVEKVF